MCGSIPIPAGNLAEDIRAQYRIDWEIFVSKQNKTDIERFKVSCIIHI
jgi:hypothetical protein